MMDCGRTEGQRKIMWSLTISGVDFYHIISWFIIYSFFGWVWETTYVSLKQGRYVNRGFINGPLCTIYGCGAIAVYLILKPIADNLLLLFLGGIVVATLLEYLTAVLMENIFHTSWWDYSDNHFNFQGRICLGASLGWGVFTVILFYILQPLVEDIVELYPVFVGKIGVCVIAVAYAADFCYSSATAFHLHERIPAWEQALEQKQGELLLRLNNTMNGLEKAKSVSLDTVKERIEDVEIIRGFEEKRQAMLKEISGELKSYKETLASKIGHNAKRYVKSYPNLNRGYRLRHKDKKQHKQS